MRKGGEGDADDENTQFLQKGVPLVLTQRRTEFWSRLAVGSITLNIITAAIVVIVFLQNSLSLIDVELCTRELSTYSPALEAVEYYKYEYPNDFYERDEYRGPPTPEREAAWRRLWQMGDIVIKTSELKAINKTDQASLYNPDINGIAANLEVFHQLHCLHMIRAYTYLEYYTEDELPVDFQDVDDAYRREHVDHCISTLRLAITCASDVTPILLTRDPSNPLSVLPDFRTSHTCRNFDVLQEWFIQNSYTDWECIQNRAIGCDVFPTGT
ncbi:putative Tat pathway signal sequence [Seiridium cardinale]